MLLFQMLIILRKHFRPFMSVQMSLQAQILTSCRPLERCTPRSRNCSRKWKQMLRKMHLQDCPANACVRFKARPKACWMDLSPKESFARVTKSICWKRKAWRSAIQAARGMCKERAPDLCPCMAQNSGACASLLSSPTAMVFSVWRDAIA